MICYFDDIVSDGHQLHCSRVGELLAIDNSTSSKTLTICWLHSDSLRVDLMFPAVWTQQFRVYHRFQHVDYNTYIGM